MGKKSHQFWQGQHKRAQQAQVCCERLLCDSHDIPLQMNAAHASSVLGISLQAPHSLTSTSCMRRQLAICMQDLQYWCELSYHTM